MAEFFAPQLDNMAFLRNALGMQQFQQQGQMAPLQVAQAQQQVQRGAMDLYFQRLRMAALASDPILNSQSQQPAAGTQQNGSQNIGGASGGIGGGPQAQVSSQPAQPYGLQQQPSPLDPMVSPQRMQYTARLADFGIKDPQEALSKYQSQVAAQRESDLKVRQLKVQQEVMPLVTSVMNNPDADRMVDLNPTLKAAWAQYRQEKGLDTRPAHLTPEDAQQAAWEFGNKALLGVGLPAMPPLERYGHQNLGLGGMSNVNRVTNKVEPGLPQQATGNFIVKDPSAVGGIRVVEKTKAQGVAQGLAPADAQTLALSTITPQEIKMAGDSMEATGQFPQWLAGRDSFTRAIFGTALAKRFEGSGNTQAALAAKAQEYQASGEVLNSFTDGKSGPSQSIVAINTATQHLGVLRPLVKALNTGNSNAINQAQLAFQKQFGATAPVSFDAVKQFVTQEVAKANVPGGGVSAEREELGDSLSKANTFAQLSDVLDKYQQLMAGKTEALRTLWDVGTKGQHGPFDQFLLPATKAATERSAQGFNPKVGVPTKHPSGATVTIHE